MFLMVCTIFCFVPTPCFLLNNNHNKANNFSKKNNELKSSTTTTKKLGSSKINFDFNNNFSYLFTNKNNFEKNHPSFIATLSVDDSGFFTPIVLQNDDVNYIGFSGTTNLNNTNANFDLVTSHNNAYDLNINIELYSYVKNRAKLNESEIFTDKKLKIKEINYSSNLFSDIFNDETIFAIDWRSYDYSKVANELKRYINENLEVFFNEPYSTLSISDIYLSSLENHSYLANCKLNNGQRFEIEILLSKTPSIEQITNTFYIEISKINTPNTVDELVDSIDKLIFNNLKSIYKNKIPNYYLSSKPTVNNELIINTGNGSFTFNKGAIKLSNMPESLESLNIKFKYYNYRSWVYVLFIVIASIIALLILILLISIIYNLIKRKISRNFDIIDYDIYNPKNYE